MIVDGEVVRYEAGRVIVIRGADNKESVYTLSPSIVVPKEVKVGRRVTLYTEPGTDGRTQLVSRVTTTSVSILPLATTASGAPVAQTITYTTTSKTETVPPR